MFKHNNINYSNYSNNIDYKYNYKIYSSLLLHLLFLFSFSLILSVIPHSPIFADGGGGGGGEPEIPSCDPEIINKIVGKCSGDSGLYGICYYKCKPYRPSLSSWDSIKASIRRVSNFNVSFNTTPSSGYHILDASLFSEYISSGNLYDVSGYNFGEQLYANYCNKWVVGISKDYMNSVLQSGPRPPRPNIDIRIFCDDVQGGYSFAKVDPIVGISYNYENIHIFCRDGTYHLFEESPCKVATEYRVKGEKFCASYRKEKECVSESTCFKEEIADGKCNEGQDKYCTEWRDVDVCNYKWRVVDDTSYDTGFVFFKYHHAFICNRPYITDNIKDIDVVKLYDPNLVFN